MAEFLLELLSEEIPARMQVRAKGDLQALICKALDDADLAYGRVESFATPRRLVLAIDDLAGRQPDLDVERKGPRVGAPEKALEGFKRSLGVESYELTEEEDKKGAIYVARFRRAGRPTADLLSEIVPGVLKNFPWPKSMRWGNHDVRWVRPLQSILCLLDGAVIPFTFGPVSSGNKSCGHRFHAPHPFEVTSFDQYGKELARRFVVLDRDERRDGIKGQAELIAKQKDLHLRQDDGLLDEVTGLVEWPVAVCGSIDAEFMELPSEVLVTSMRAHQKYLALEDDDGELAPKFVAIANLEAKDGGEAIIAGNERVLRARLWDAKFFWDQDRRQPLGELVSKLDDIVFHAKLGSIGEKVLRLNSQIIMLAPWMDRLDDTAAERAASLAKADLVTGMVGEFPELQGVMGGYYAKAHGETDTVAEAIGEHYAPQGPNDRCPSAPASVAVALADKLDTLAGFFNIGEKPTGSRDPFALRRAALGVIRLIIENRLRIPLKEAFRDSLLFHGGQKSVREAVVTELMTFFADRLKVHLRESGVRHDLISAVFATGDDDLVRTLARVEALEKFLATQDGADLLAGYRRASNIVRIEAKKDGINLDGTVDASFLEATEERVLYEGLAAAEHRIKQALADEDFEGAMAALADLRKPIDSFFDKVIVNADQQNIRRNRLNLLSNIHRSIETIADFSLIEDITTENHNQRVA